MKKPTTISAESVSEYREFVELRLRKRVLERIEIVIEERSARTGRLSFLSRGGSEFRTSSLEISRAIALAVLSQRVAIFFFADDSDGIRQYTQAN